MASTKEIRVSLELDEHQKTAADFAVLAVIRGVSYEGALVDAMNDHIKRYGKPLLRGTWLSQTDLIDRLKDDYGITTNSQTLMNYRNEGRLNKLYCSDGKKKVFYLLEEIVKVFQSPRNRRHAEKTVAA